MRRKLRCFASNLSTSLYIFGGLWNPRGGEGGSWADEHVRSQLLSYREGRLTAPCTHVSTRQTTSERCAPELPRKESGNIYLGPCSPCWAFCPALLCFFRPKPSVWCPCPQFTHQKPHLFSAILRFAISIVILVRFFPFLDFPLPSQENCPLPVLELFFSFFFFGKAVEGTRCDRGTAIRDLEHRSNLGS